MEASEANKFDPKLYNLDNSFRLTRFSDLRGWGCKVPQNVLTDLLSGLIEPANVDNKLAIGMFYNNWKFYL